MNIISSLLNFIGEQIDAYNNSVRVTETGTSGIWTYRKWSDGTVEAWGSKTETLSFSSWGSLYYIRMAGDNYPSGLFTSVDLVEGQFVCAPDVVSSIRNAGLATTLSTTTAPYILGIRPSTFEASPVKGLWYVVGKWQ